MSTKNGTVANGAATKNSTEKTQSVNQVNGEAKKLADQPTVEYQRERSRKLNDLFEKEAKLVESRETLKSFRVSSDENTNELILKDGKGTQFRTCNATAIAHVLDLVKKTIDEKIAEVQTKIITA